MAYCERATLERRNHDFEYRMVAADGRTSFVEAVKEFDSGHLKARLLELLAPAHERARATARRLARSSHR